MDLLQEFYETTLEALKDAKNDRLWFKTNTKVQRNARLIYSIEVHGALEEKKWTICFFHTVGEAVPGERGVWKIAKDPETTSSVMPGIEAFGFCLSVLAVWLLDTLIVCEQSLL